MFRRLLVANRGEVAARIRGACEALGVEPVFAVSEADVDAPYTRGCESVVIGPSRATESYLDPMRLIAAAKETRCSAVHPGWGFLSENAVFATLCEQHGLAFVGAPAQVMALMGQKTPAKRLMREAGVTVIGGSDGPVSGVEEIRALGAEIGYPLLLKAESGGGGRGMRVVRSESELESAFGDCENEARTAFGDARVYVEQFIEGGRHVEVQLMADKYGNVVHVGERDCSVQRNHQKLIEESPAPTLTDASRQEAFDAAVQAAKRIGYVGAGTLEMLMDASGKLRFMEMNTRLQVEHGVSEMRSRVDGTNGGKQPLDLMAEQIRVAAGNELSWKQEDIGFEGHVIECRINAEDPANGFKPCPGKIDAWSVPAQDWLRVDTHVEPGYTVPPFYDSMVAKLLTWGKDREEAIARMLQALGEVTCVGIQTTIPLHQAVLASDDFKTGNYDTRTIPGWSL